MKYQPNKLPAVEKFDKLKSGVIFMKSGLEKIRLAFELIRAAGGEPDGNVAIVTSEYHLCLRVAGDYDKIREYHREMGCICYENTDMGLYFISDPDGYWIEILPLKQ